MISNARFGGRAVVVSAWSIHVPGLDAEGSLWRSFGPACAADRAHELLGRKGLLKKEPATRLALCAVHRALERPPGAGEPSEGVDTRTAVVASSNLGNVATVSEVLLTLRAGSVRDISALDAPNASSNVIASTVAIRFGFGGPNLMVCSGATGGLDAIVLAGVILRRGRADRAVVVGAEPDDAVASRLHGARSAAVDFPYKLRAGAAAVILESVPRAQPGSIVLSDVRSTKSRDVDSGSLLIGPSEAVTPGSRFVDVTQEVGDTYGAAGVIQAALAASLLRSGGEQTVELVCGDPVDGYRFVGLRRLETE